MPGLGWRDVDGGPGADYAKRSIIGGQTRVWTAQVLEVVEQTQALHFDEGLLGGL